MQQLPWREVEHGANSQPPPKGPSARPSAPHALARPEVARARLQSLHDEKESCEHEARVSPLRSSCTGNFVGFFPFFLSIFEKPRFSQ